MKIKAVTYLLGLFSSFCPAYLNAQDTTKTHLEYANQFLSGMIAGRDHSGPGVIFEMSHGIRYHRFQAGLLTGLAVYNDWQLMPLGADVSFTFLRFRGNSLFLRADGGRAVAGRPTYSDSFYGKASLNRAWDCGLGAGYRWAIGKFSIYLAGAYRYQKLHYARFYPINYYDDFASPMNFYNKVTYDESYGRWALQLGFGLH